MKFLLLGLGNPGPQYEKSRHNAGFSFLDAFMRQYSAEKIRQNERFTLWQIKQQGQTIFLAKPWTYMNLSGTCMSELHRRTGVSVSDTCVICDNMDLPVCRGKIKFGGGSAGQKGLQNIMGFCGTSFWRLYMGIGRPIPPQDVPSYVLGRFPAEIEEEYLGFCDKIAQIFGETLPKSGFLGVQQIVNSL